MGLSIHSANMNNTGWLPAPPEPEDKWEESDVLCPHCASEDGERVQLFECDGRYHCPGCSYDYSNLDDVVEEAVEILLLQED